MTLNHFQLIQRIKNNEHIFGHGDPRRFLGEKNGKTKIYEYAVILEDDLELATDAVNFFSSMTWPMSRDSTIFCACAHQDNAYFAMSIEIDANAYGGKDGSSIFAFRRGEHFMAPGWMTSRSVYNKVIRPTWFDLHGELLPWARMRLYNGNWDTYLDYRVEVYGVRLSIDSTHSSPWGGGIHCKKRSTRCCFWKLKTEPV